MKLLLVLLFIMSSLHAEPAKTSALWGKIIRSDKTIKNVSYKYFVYFEQNGKSHAYPVDTDNTAMAAKIEKSVGQNAHLEGNVKEVTLSLDGPKQKILVFIPTEIRPLTLSQLAINDPVMMDAKTPDKPKDTGEYRGGGIRISDKLANGMIYTGAAVMLGSLLLQK